MDISVIIPFHNAERFIGRCIEGLLAQRCPGLAYEIIMIDNNSTDGSAEIVRQHPRIHLLTEQTPGAYAARNKGLREARGEVIAFTDPDCVPAPEWLSNVAAAMENRQVGIAIGAYQAPGASLPLRLLTAYENAKEEYIFNNARTGLYYGHTNNMAVCATLFEELGLFCERQRGADTLFVRKAVERHSHQVVQYCPRMKVQHLEVDSVFSYYRKRFIYGQSMSALREQAPLDPIQMNESWLMLRHAMRAGRYPLLRMVLLCGLHLGGMLCWRLGVLSHKALKAKRVRAGDHQDADHQTAA